MQEMSENNPESWRLGNADLAEATEVEGEGRPALRHAPDKDNHDGLRRQVCVTRCLIK